MLEFSRFAVLATTVLVVIALLGYVAVLNTSSKRRAVAKELAGVGAASGSALDDVDIADIADAPTTRAETASVASAAGRGLGWYATAFVRLALVVLTAGLVARTIAVGHAPMANQYEFAISFVWGILAAYVYFEWRYKTRALALAVLPVSIALLLYADTVGAEAAPLIPALQNHLLLTAHVVTAVLAYGACAVGFGAAVLYLIKRKVTWGFLPSDDLLDEIGYRSTVIAFPLITVMIILGAIWADIAWGSYWSWDPKETAALVTWLVYGAYLHARVVRDWRGTRAAWLLILGFAAVVFTYFGNQFFGGLHAYA